MVRLALFLLGTPRIEVNGEPVHIGRRKGIALLAYLAVEQGYQARDKLAALLWPEYDQSKALADLRRTLSLLKSKLGGGWLVADRETASLSPEEDPWSTPLSRPDALSTSSGRSLWLDVRSFDQRLTACAAHGHPPVEPCPDCLPLLEEAVELYRGDFLSGFTLRDSLAFDEWQFFQTERLKGQLTSALERLVHWYTEEREYERAIAHARRRLEVDLLNETAHRGLMQLFARAGQQTAALRQYQLCAGTLTAELGRLPSPETTALFERIRAGEEIRWEREVESSVSHNLPSQLTSFVGREAELADLDRYIRDPEVRLITITGPGGIGKTRLALAAAERYLSATRPAGIASAHKHQPDLHTSSELLFPNGVFFVPLTAVGSADLIVPSLAEALGFRFEAGERVTRAPEQQVLDYLRDRRLLLILDNFEHLLSPLASPSVRGIEGGLDLIVDILRTAPGVQMLVTSREHLPLHGQQVFPIHGLEYPTRDAPTGTADYAAARLFLQAARRARPGFELEGDDVAFLANICRLLEGTPLGIELAASWVDLLSLRDIAAEVQQGLDFLETEWQDMPSRHRSMRAVIESSWRRMSEVEQEVCARLCVFRRGFTRAAAREVVGADLRTLASLTNKSLLDYRKVRGRYEMHELLRQFGVDRLAADQDSEATVRDRHSVYFCAALGRWLDDLTGSREVEALEEIETDLENVRAAWEWAAVQAHADRLYQAMDGLGQFFLERARVAEGDRLFQLAYDRLAETSQPLDVGAQQTLARVLLWRSRFDKMSLLHRQAKDLLQQSQTRLDDLAPTGQDIRSERAFLHDMLGLATQPDWETSARHCEQALALYRQLGHRYSAAWALCQLGESNRRSGKPETAMRNFEDALVLFRALGHQSGWCWALTCLGNVARDQGDYDRAQRMYNESLARARAQRNRRRTVDSLRHMGCLALLLGRFQAAADYLEESVAISQEVGDWIRVTFTSSDLATAYWFSGAFDQAYAMLERILTIIEERGLADSHYALAYQAWLDVYTGRYDVAQTRARESLELNPHDEPYGVTSVVPYWVLGWAALADEAYAKAFQPLRQAISALRKGMVDESLEFIAWSMAPLGRAAPGQGDHEAARSHLSEGLQIAVQIRGFIPLLHLMPIAALLLAEEDDAAAKEQAVELQALARSHPFLDKAQLFEDIAWRKITATTADLPPEAITAARARGRALDWWETAEELLRELRELGWG